MGSLELDRPNFNQCFGLHHMTKIRYLIDCWQSDEGKFFGSPVAAANSPLLSEHNVLPWGWVGSAMARHTLYRFPSFSPMAEQEKVKSPQSMLNSIDGAIIPSTSFCILTTSTHCSQNTLTVIALDRVESLFSQQFPTQLLWLIPVYINGGPRSSKEYGPQAQDWTEQGGVHVQ